MKTLNSTISITDMCKDWENTVASVSSNFSYAANEECRMLINDMIKKEVSKTPEVPIETKTKLVNKGRDLYVRFFDKGFFKSERHIMPDIKDVKVAGNVVFVTFADNTKTKAVLDSEDDFNLEQGISICITKKLLGDSGDSIYNKLIKRAFQVKTQNEREAEKAKRVYEEEKSKKEKALARYQKRKAKKREDAIEIQKEAYLRAMREFNGNN